MKSCLICDDHVLVREALAGTVKMGWPGVAVTEVGDFPSAWAEAAKGQETCIADLMMPGAGPLAGIAGIQRAAPDTRILVVTGTEDDALLLELLDMGIAGFAPKTASGSIIEAALRLIAAGGRYLPPRLAEIAASRIDTGMVDPLRDDTLARTSRLTNRQLEILRHASLGATTKEIALLLGLAPSTVKSHLSHIQDCLGAKNRIDAATRARALNLI